VATSIITLFFGDGDDDFFQNFVRGDIVYFYMHLLFKGDPPRYCLRDLDVSQKSDLGCSEESNVSVLSESGKKRIPGGDLTREDFQELFQRSEVEDERDKAMSDYFTSLTRKNEQDELSAFIAGPGFASHTHSSPCA
jgi:hypothetical protein